MAKRRRLSPARPDVFSPQEAGTPVPASSPLSSEGTTAPPSPGLPTPQPLAQPLSPPRPARVPIAQMAGDAASAAALGEMQAALETARREGRMVMSLPLVAVVEDHLIRDRLVQDPEEMAALQDSLRRRGQQTPIEVSDLGGGRYGLISGWRRLQALRALHADSGGQARYATVQALVRLPADRPAAYVAMVEENEVRANLSFYERARIVARAVEAGVFDSDKAALQSLFAAVSFSKRSKIKSFLPLVTALDGVLQHPGQIPERLGLALSTVLKAEGPGAATLIAGLSDPAPRSVEEERALLEAALDPLPGASAPRAQATTKEAVRSVALSGRLKLKARVGRLALEGDGVTEALIADLEAWLRQRDS